MEAAGHLLGGIVAGEGCFRRSERREAFSDGSARIRFVFELSLVTADRPLVEALQWALGGAGAIRDRPPRRSHWQGETCLTIASERAHVASTIPFADRYLPPCHKRSQFERWRDELVAYRAHRETVVVTGRSVCRIVGCGAIVRWQGLCRRHY